MNKRVSYSRGCEHSSMVYGWRWDEHACRAYGTLRYSHHGDGGSVSLSCYRKQSVISRKNVAISGRMIKFGNAGCCCERSLPVQHLESPRGAKSGPTIGTNMTNT